MISHVRGVFYWLVLHLMRIDNDTSTHLVFLSHTGSMDWHKRREFVKALGVPDKHVLSLTGRDQFDIERFLVNLPWRVDDAKPRHFTLVLYRPDALALPRQMYSRYAPVFFKPITGPVARKLLGPRDLLAIKLSEA